MKLERNLGRIVGRIGRIWEEDSRTPGQVLLYLDHVAEDSDCVLWFKLRQ